MNKSSDPRQYDLIKLLFKLYLSIDQINSEKLKQFHIGAFHQLCAFICRSNSNMEFNKLMSFNKNKIFRKCKFFGHFTSSSVVNSKTFDCFDQEKNKWSGYKTCKNMYSHFFSTIKNKHWIYAHQSDSSWNEIAFKTVANDAHNCRHLNGTKHFLAH